MSQKTNPISLRLQKSNKHFDSCWYSDFFYGQVLKDELDLRIYMEGLLFQAGRAKTSPSIQSQYKRYCTLLFFLDQRAERHKREFSLKVPREPIERAILPRIKVLQNKKRSYVFPWNSALFPQVQNILCKERFSEQEKSKKFIREVTKQEKASSASSVHANKSAVNTAEHSKAVCTCSRLFLEERYSCATNDKQGYVYRYAIKNSFLKLLFLAGLDYTNFCNRKYTHSYNVIVNPGLKQKLSQGVSTLIKGCSSLDNNLKLGFAAFPAWQNRQRGINNTGLFSYMESKDFSCVSPMSFALYRSIPYRQESEIKCTALLSPTKQASQSRSSLCEDKERFARTKQSFVRAKLQQSKALFAQERKALCSGDSSGDGGEPQLELGFQAPSKNLDIVLLKSQVFKKYMHNIFSIQEGRENLFRHLIIAKYSQSTQNRLSFWFVKGKKDQLQNSNTPDFLVDLSVRTNNAKLDCASNNRRTQQNTAKLCYSVSGENLLKKNSISTCGERMDKSECRKTSHSLVQQEWRSKSLRLPRHTELFLNTYSGNFLYHTIYPIRAISPFQSVGFLLESIAYLLQRKSSFRKIKDDLFRELDQYRIIKGVRLSCAGRLGGRSKKAQKAKTQSAQWGETSLNVFCSRLAFASKGVKTTYGKVGVKLWVCFY